MKKLLITFIFLNSLASFAITPEDKIANLVEKQVSKTKISWKDEKMETMFQWFEKNTGELYSSVIQNGYDDFDMLKLENQEIQILIPFKIEDKEAIPMYSFDIIPKEIKETLITIVLNSNETSYDYSDYKNWKKDPNSFKEMIENNNKLNKIQKFLNAFDYGDFYTELIEEIYNSISENFYGYGNEYSNFKSINGIVDLFTENIVSDGLTITIEMNENSQEYLMVLNGVGFINNTQAEIYIYIPLNVISVNPDNMTFKIEPEFHKIQTKIFKFSGSTAFEKNYNLEQLDEFFTNLLD